MNLMVTQTYGVLKVRGTVRYAWGKGVLGLGTPVCHQVNATATTTGTLVFLPGLGTLSLTLTYGSVISGTALGLTIQLLVPRSLSRGCDRSLFMAWARREHS
jgi:hypothetical protein